VLEERSFSFEASLLLGGAARQIGSLNGSVSIQLPTGLRPTCIGRNTGILLPFRRLFLVSNHLTPMFASMQSDLIILFSLTGNGKVLFS